jgi:hypothetical protein
MIVIYSQVHTLLQLATEIHFAEMNKMSEIVLCPNGLVCWA